MTLLEFVELKLPKEFIDYEKCKNSNFLFSSVYIKEEYQIDANKIYLRSQAFTPKAPVEIWAPGFPITDKKHMCKIEYFFADPEGKIYLVDSTNKITPSIHVDNFSNYD